MRVYGRDERVSVCVYIQLRSVVIFADSLQYEKKKPDILVKLWYLATHPSSTIF